MGIAWAQLGIPTSHGHSQEQLAMDMAWNSQTYPHTVVWAHLDIPTQHGHSYCRYTHIAWAQLGTVRDTHMRLAQLGIPTYSSVGTVVVLQAGLPTAGTFTGGGYSCLSGSLQRLRQLSTNGPTSGLYSTQTQFPTYTHCVTVKSMLSTHLSILVCQCSWPGHITKVVL